MYEHLWYLNNFVNLTLCNILGTNASSFCAKSNSNASFGLIVEFWKLDIRRIETNGCLFLKKIMFFMLGAEQNRTEQKHIKAHFWQVRLASWTNGS